MMQVGATEYPSSWEILDAPFFLGIIENNRYEERRVFGSPLFLLLESHTEPVPELVFHFLPGLSGGTGEVGGVLVEERGGFLGLAFVDEGLGFFLQGGDFVEGLVFETGHGAE